METSIEQLKEEALAALGNAGDPAEIQALTVRYLGKKGLLTQYLRTMATLDPEDRPAFGQRVNAAKEALETAFSEKKAALETAAADRATDIDITLPGRKPSQGTLHPLTRIRREISDIFSRLGFEISEGPEVELDWYNFEALNIPPHHPARDMQDTFYVSDRVVLRTHTSPIQIRFMENHKPPIRIIAPGRVYRCDSDITHTPMFHQIEGLLVDEKASFGDLKGILTAFIHALFDKDTSLRFRPSFFPFTEPSAEVDIRCVMCRGEGCRICSQTGWLEVLGCGMVHPVLFENTGIDPERYRGFAFGMGVERLTMLKYGIDDLRKFFENDIRFLEQF
ncbi:phenylalanyl-tRNA synthetase alpha subunit [Desulfobotulus alkaliphilus]|uniref:Phenylalanine--tRNA ligase alpha subunit n=1 Tax=Desulfobotulus alkaliphilus TaxID=622671 RepID=A0A562RAE0_9BACT|nr:phenylalanine--tRNA ligase subunit alpha [Desulfobotulus alkaliphilus]TWI66039.1 phenylalanyl-tRNA synthetase alpha subunit [Desulfobotulus alkaliphilus]